MLLHLGSARQEAHLSGGPCGDRARIGILGAPGPSVAPGQRGAQPLTAHRTKGGGQGLHDQRQQRRWTRVINEDCSRTSASLIRLSPLSWSPSAPHPKPCEAVELTDYTEPQTLYRPFCLVSPGVTTTRGDDAGLLHFASIHEHMHICVHTHVCTHKHIYTHAHMHVRAHTHTHTHVQPGWAELPYCSFMLPFIPGLPSEIFWESSS